MRGLFLWAVGRGVLPVGRWYLAGVMRTPAFVLGLSLLVGFGSVSCTKKVAAQGGAPAKGGPTRVIRFGSGGGFTGAVTTFALTNDGHLTRRAGTPTDTTQPAVRLASPPAAAVIRSFPKLDALSPDSLRLQRPGNLSYFLEGQTAAGQPVQLTWGYPGAAISPKARALYYELMALVPGGG